MVKVHFLDDECLSQMLKREQLLQSFGIYMYVYNPTFFLWHVWEMMNDQIIEV